ncbi:methyltransferase domain-containing protein [Bacillus sp. DNRA2]|nr:methyltransferase domain-containing protein [Bacillus sp. DNRA2]
MKQLSRQFVKWYDFFMNPLEKGKFKAIRKDLLKEARGKVLEIGSGTGVNFPLYEIDLAEAVYAIEPNPAMIEKSFIKKQKAAVPIEIVGVGAEQLPFMDNCFDTVVATLVFCTIPNVDSALNEIKRVLKPGGKILFFEHVKMENRFLAQLQDWLTPAWKRICDGCCLNRNTIKLLKSHSLEITEKKDYYKGLFVIIKATKPL